MDPKCNNI